MVRCQWAAGLTVRWSTRRAPLDGPWRAARHGSAGCPMSRPPSRPGAPWAGGGRAPAASSWSGWLRGVRG